MPSWKNVILQSTAQNDVDENDYDADEQWLEVVLYK